MAHWQEGKTGYFRENEDGTIDKHPYRYVSHDGHIMRATYENGRCTKVEPYENTSYLVVDKSTGDIKSHVTGFNLSEALGDEPHCPDGCEIVKLTASERCPHCRGVENKKHHEIVPADFIVDGKITYCCRDGKLEKKA